MLPPHLTDEEIASITAPLTQGAARCRFFEELGCHVMPRPNGQPLVGRAHFEEVMRGRLKVEGAANDAPAAAVNLQALRERVKLRGGEKAQGG